MTLFNVYIGGVTGDVWKYFPNLDPDATIPSKGVMHFIFDDTKGLLEQSDTVGGDLFSPQYLALHPSLPVLYAAEFAAPGRLASFNIDVDGRLRSSSRVKTLGAMAIAVAINPSGTYAYVVHLGDGVLAACPLDGTGSIIEATSVSPSLSGTKLHHAVVTPNGEALIVVDFGADGIYVYQLDKAGIPLNTPSRIDFPAGSSPRHIELHPSGQFAYALGEGDARLYVLEAEDHIPRRIISSHSVSPTNFSGRCSPSELQLHPDGQTLFVGVRRADCISVFDVGDAGEISVLHHQPSHGRNPRTLSLDPGGRHLLVGNWHSNDMTVFAIDEDRRLSPIGSPTYVPSPSSIVFGAAAP